MAEIQQIDEGNGNLQEGRVNVDKLILIARANRSFRLAQEGISKLVLQSSSQYAEFAHDVSQFERLNDRDDFFWEKIPENSSFKR